MDSDGVPSAAVAEPHLAAMAEAGVSKLLLLGSNGEGPLVPTVELDDYLGPVIARWRELVPHGVTVVNVTAAGTREALARAHAANRAGATGVAVSPPIYFHHRDDEIVDHFRRFEDCSLPTVAYNIPRYANPLTPSVIEGLSSMTHVVGAKDSSGDPDILARLVEIGSHRAEFAVSAGAEAKLLQALEAGAVGLVPGTANLAPVLALELLDAWREQRVSEAAQFQSRISELATMHAIRPGVPAVKAMLADRGLLTPYVTPPLLGCSDAELGRLRDLMVRCESDLLGRPHTPQ
ncbi:MAG TPA: dihydrodipicolinate synthase family protein [Candidatus Ruania gallistercoris]|uniref:Dihydrodipicolinate synthase family protein n=1 Tax=Candidatus Ruania gallistercoris TaxID=2838746 RepID=A0A9D2EEE4_9MICO|nr:dihydrodipicolinate synthase family protein [Candidatus Ruania gallistercoris]